MSRIKLVADPEYYDAFARTFTKAGFTIEFEEHEIVVDASFLRPQEKLEELGALDEGSIVVTNTLTLSATSQKAAIPSGTVIGVPMLPNYFDRQTSLEYCLPLGDTSVDIGFLEKLGRTPELIGDAIAGVFARAIAMVINEAAFALQEGVATVVDIDQAMKLGTNYPKGPLAWCDEIGAATVVSVLEALSREYGADRYRPAALLRRHAEGNLKFYRSRIDPAG